MSSTQDQSFKTLKIPVKLIALLNRLLNRKPEWENTNGHYSSNLNTTFTSGSLLICSFSSNEIRTHLLLSLPSIITCFFRTGQTTANCVKCTQLYSKCHCTCLKSVRKKNLPQTQKLVLLSSNNRVYPLQPLKYLR